MSTPPNTMNTKAPKDALLPYGGPLAHVTMLRLRAVHSRGKDGRRAENPEANESVTAVQIGRWLNPRATCQQDEPLVELEVTKPP